MALITFLKAHRTDSQDIVIPLNCLQVRCQCLLSLKIWLTQEKKGQREGKTKPGETAGSDVSIL